MAYPEGVITRTVKTTPLLDYATGQPLRGLASLLPERSPLWAATGSALLANTRVVELDSSGVATFLDVPTADQPGWTDGLTEISGWTSTLSVASRDPNQDGPPDMTFVVVGGTGPMVIAPDTSTLRTAGVTVELVDVPVLPGGVSVDFDGVPYYDPEGAPVGIDDDDAPYYVA